MHIKYTYVGVLFEWCALGQIGENNSENYAGQVKEMPRLNAMNSSRMCAVFHCVSYIYIYNHFILLFFYLLKIFSSACGFSQMNKKKIHTILPKMIHMKSRTDSIDEKSKNRVFFFNNTKMLE